MAIIKIKNLSLRVIVGINSWERKKKQDILINITIEYDSTKAVTHDDVSCSVDYKSLTKGIIAEVDQSQFFLLEALADFILKSVMKHEQILSAIVEVDKPYALRFAESVSVLVSDRRNLS